SKPAASCLLDGRCNRSQSKSGDVQRRDHNEPRQTSAPVCPLFAASPVESHGISGLRSNTKASAESRGRALHLLHGECVKVASLQEVQPGQGWTISPQCWRAG